MQKDRVGLGWRPELALGIFKHLDQIDILEVIGNDYLGASQGDALRLLARQIPLHIHGIDLGMAGSEDVNRKRVQRLMRLMGLEAIYPKPRTTVAGRGHKVYPYLLRGWRSSG